MQTFFTRLYEGYGRAKLALCMLGVAVWGILVVLSGGNLWGGLLVLLAAVCCILLPGRFWRRLLRLDAFLPNYAFPLSLLLGTGSFLVLYCVCMRLGALVVLRILPLVLGAAGILAFRPAGEELQRRHFPAQPHQLLLMLLVCTLVFVYGWAGVVKYAHPSAAGQILLNQDFLWNVGNADSFLIRFPPQDIRFYNVRLTYHYLTEMLAACLSLVTGVSCYDVLAYYQQPLMLGCLVACVYCFGRYFFRREDGEPDVRRALIFTFSLFCFGCASLWKILPNGASVFWNSNITHLITNINSQATAVIYLSIFSALFLEAARRRFRMGFFPFAVLLASFVMLCFAKGPVAAIAACAAVLTVLLLAVQGRAGWRGAAVGLCLAALFGFIYLKVFASGAGSSMHLTLAGSLEKSYFGNFLRVLKAQNYRVYRATLLVLIPVQSLLMLPAAMPLFVRGALGDVRRLFRLEAGPLYCTASAVGGLLAFFLFDHPAMSQVYFFLMSIFFFDLLAVRQLGTLRPAPADAPPRRRAARRLWVLCVGFFACAGAVTALFNYVNLCGSGLRQLLHNENILEKYPYECVMTADDEAAADWLHDNTTAEGCLFATNRIHTGARAEGISNLYSALSGRQGFMEGFQYAVTNMGVPEVMVQERLDVNYALFSASSTPYEIRTLCARYGITHILYSRQMGGDEEQLKAFPCVYSGPDVRIYQISAAG